MHLHNFGRPASTPKLGAGLSVQLVLKLSQPASELHVQGSMHPQASSDAGSMGSSRSWKRPASVNKPSDLTTK